jgi:hypothetical protein
MNLDNDSNPLLAQRRIPDDTCVYAFHFPSTARSQLEAVRDEILAFVDDQCRGYIWHRDSFNLRVSEKPGSDDAWLEGRTAVGDCVDDEWWIVWFAREVTKRWQGAVARCAPLCGPYFTPYIDACLFFPSASRIRTESSS